MTRFLFFLDRVIDVGLVFVLVFTPLAFGAVEDWAQAVAQTAIMIVFTAWVLKLTWAPAPQDSPPERGTILSGRVRLSGLELPALLFATVVLIQLVPMPPSVVRVLSPRTAEIFTQSLPGYGESDSPSFRDLPRWLQSDPEPEAGGVPALPPDPELAAQALPPEVFDVSHPAWRPLSLTPAHTKRALQIFLAHFALFVVAFNVIGERSRALRVLYAIAALCGVLSLLGILQSLTPEAGLYWWRGSGPTYSFGPFVNANHFAGWMEMALPVTVGLAAMIWTHQMRNSRTSGRLLEQAGRGYASFVILAFVIVVGFTAFVVAKSRGGFLAFTTAVGVYALVTWAAGKLRLRVVAVAAFILLAAVALAAWIDLPELLTRYGTLSDVGSDPSFQARIDFSRHTLRMAMDFPVFGTGLGTFAEAYDLYAPGTSHVALRRAHNDYAQVFAECGLGGLLAAVWALLILIRRGMTPGLVRRGSAFRWIVSGAAVGVLAILLHSVVDFNLQIYSNSVLFVFLCAFLLRDRLGDTARRGRDSA